MQAMGDTGTRRLQYQGDSVNRRTLVLGGASPVQWAEAYLKLWGHWSLVWLLVRPVLSGVGSPSVWALCCLLALLGLSLCALLGW